MWISGWNANLNLQFAYTKLPWFRNVINKKGVTALKKLHNILQNILEDRSIVCFRKNFGFVYSLPKAVNNSEVFLKLTIDRSPNVFFFSKFSNISIVQFTKCHWENRTEKWKGALLSCTAICIVHDNWHITSAYPQISTGNSCSKSSPHALYTGVKMLINRCKFFSICRYVYAICYLNRFHKILEGGDAITWW